MKSRKGGTGRSARSAYPFLVAEPVPLSRHVGELRKVEESHWFTNFGPVVCRFEREFLARLFDGTGHCTTVSNATLGLLLSIRARMLQVLGETEARRRRIAILPSFTFPATAQAAVWNGLEVAFCDIDPETWLPDHRDIERLVRKHAGRVAVVVPYATFGNNLDVAWYESLEERHGVPVVIDAAASIGARNPAGNHFAHGSRVPAVFSMHATKLLATSEGGVVYSSDAGHIAMVRSMANFGFDADRVVTLPGINAKLPEIAALQAVLKLARLPQLIRKRERLVARYRRALPALEFQSPIGTPVFPFLPVRISGAGASVRDAVIGRAAGAGVEIRKYYNPPLHRQSFFGASSRALPVTDAVSDDILTLPLFDSLEAGDVDAIADVVSKAIAAVTARPKRRSRAS